jgi:hypothetical protein
MTGAAHRAALAFVWVAVRSRNGDRTHMPRITAKNDRGSGKDVNGDREDSG